MASKDPSEGKSRTEAEGWTPVEESASASAVSLRQRPRWLNSLRAALGLRALPPIARQPSPPETAAPEAIEEDDPEALQRAKPYLVAAGVFVLLAVACFWAYGRLATGPSPAEAERAGDLLRQAVAKLESGDASGMRQYRDQAVARFGNAPVISFFDGYILATEARSKPDLARDFLQRAQGKRLPVEQLLTLAGYREATGDQKESLRLLTEAVQRVPRKVSVRLLRVGALHASGDYQAAVEEANEIERLVGPSVATFAARGHAYLALDRPHDAQKEFEKGLVYDPNSSKLRIGLTDALTRQGSLTRALGEANLVLRYEPGNADAHLAVGILHEALGDPAGAETAYRAALKDDPGHSRALNNLAYLLAVDRGKPTEALPLAQEAYRRTPNSPAVMDTLGWIHHLLGHDDQARPLVQKAVALDPKDAAAREHLKALQGQ